MNIPQIHKLSRASQLSLLAVVILLGAIFFTVNSALQQQNSAGHASSSTPTITYIQSNYAKNDVNNASVTLPQTVTKGNFLIVAVSNYEGTIASISDNVGDSFKLAQQHPTTASGYVGQISIYYVPSAVGGSTTIKATSTISSASTSVSLEAVEYSGINSTNPFDQTTSASGTSSTINGGTTATTTQANELIFAAGTFTNNSSYTLTAGSGFTYRGGNTNGSGYYTPVFVEDKNVYATGAYNATFSSSGSVTYQGAIATFRAAAAPTTVATIQPTTIVPTLAPTAAQGNTTIGNTSIGAVQDTGDTNCLNGLKVTAPSTGGTIQSVSVYVYNAKASPNNQYKIGIYSDNSGHPGSLLAQSSVGIAITGWNTIPVSLTLSPGASYWLMYYTNGDNDGKYTNGGTNLGAYYCPGNFGNFPSSLSGATLANVTYSTYATLSVNAPVTLAPTSTPVSGNLLQNPSFENGTANWYLNQFSPAVGSFTVTSSTAEDGANSAQVNVTTSDTTNWHIQLSQDGLPMTAGQTYSVNFWAKAAGSRTLEVIIQQEGGANADYADHTFNLTTSWQQFSFTYTPTITQSTVAIRFEGANYTSTFWVDNVSYAQGGIALPTATSVPTVLPKPTPSPTSVVSATPQPTTIPQPTVTPAPGDTIIALNIGLHGIGSGGDSANPTSQGNMSPLRPTRTVTVDVYDTQNQLVTSQQGTVNFDTGSGKFIGTVDLGTSFATGLYTMKVKTDQYLRGLIPGIQTITAGQTTTLPPVTLIAGDINGDNAINIIDYNILIGCYSDLLPATNCNATNNVLSDLNDDGHVNEFDYNLFLRELTNIGGQ
jgi:hypothetical protein